MARFVPIVTKLENGTVTATYQYEPDDPEACLECGTVLVEPCDCCADSPICPKCEAES